MLVLYRTFPLVKNSRGYKIYKVTQTANDLKNVSVSALASQHLISDQNLKFSAKCGKVSVSNPKVSFTSLILALLAVGEC